MFLGWYDPDRKKPARAKLADAIHRFEEKFGRTPQLCLVNPEDAIDLSSPGTSWPEPSIQIESRSYIARWTFYVGDYGAATPARMTT